MRGIMDQNSTQELTLEQIIAQATYVSDHEKALWKAVSEKLISSGRVEPITTSTSFTHAIDLLAYNIASHACRSLLFLNQSEEEYLEAAKEEIEIFDEIMYVIAFGSGVHLKIIDALVGIRVDYYTDQIIKNISKNIY